MKPSELLGGSTVTLRVASRGEGARDVDLRAGADLGSGVAIERRMQHRHADAGNAAARAIPRTPSACDPGPPSPTWSRNRRRRGPTAVLPLAWLLPSRAVVSEWSFITTTAAPRPKVAAPPPAMPRIQRSAVRVAETVKAPPVPVRTAPAPT